MSEVRIKHDELRDGEDEGLFIQFKLALIVLVASDRVISVLISKTFHEYTDLDTGNHLKVETNINTHFDYLKDIA